MSNTNFPHGFSNGVTLRNLPILNSYGGSIYWVNSTEALIGVKGTFDRPFASIVDALAHVKADKGDIIMVGPGHVETISAAAGIDIDKAGVAIVGVGDGDNRPTITFDTLTTASFEVSANNVTLQNLLFVNGIDNITSPINITGTDVSIIGCETRDNNASFHADRFITAIAADRLVISGWVHRANGGNTGALSAINIDGGNDIVIIPASIDGDFSVAIINNINVACDTLQIYGDAANPAYLRNRNTIDVIFVGVAATRGRVGPFINARLEDNGNPINDSFVGAGMDFFQPISLVNTDNTGSVEITKP